MNRSPPEDEIMKSIRRALLLCLSRLSLARTFQSGCPVYREAKCRESRGRKQVTRNFDMFRSHRCRQAQVFRLTTTGDRPPCFYPSDSAGTWKRRIELSDLKVGDELVDCQIVQELFQATTGPKVFCDCGVGRFTSKDNEWKIVNAMLRLDRKESVARKRAARLRKKKCFSAFVSRIRLDNQRLEICLTPEDIPRVESKTISASKLAVGEELIGRVVRIEPYGAFVDVGANRLGLLHINKVATLYGHYIDKTKGLVDSGLERGARLRVEVASNDRQRLFLDFTQDVKDEAAKSRSFTHAQTLDTFQQGSGAAPQNAKSEESASVAYSSGTRNGYAGTAESEGQDEYENDADDEYDEYDEDRDIEDALGLGTY